MGELKGLGIIGFEQDGYVKQTFQNYISEVFDTPPVSIRVSAESTDADALEYKIYMNNADIIHIKSYREGDAVYRTVDINDYPVYKEETDTIHYNKEFATEVYSLYLQYLEEHGV